MSCFRSSAPTARNFSCAWKKGRARFRRGAPPFKKPPPGGCYPMNLSLKWRRWASALSFACFFPHRPISVCVFT